MKTVPCPKCGVGKTSINMDRMLVYCGRCGHEWKYVPEKEDDHEKDQ